MMSVMDHAAHGRSSDPGRHHSLLEVLSTDPAELSAIAPRVFDEVAHRFGNELLFRDRPAGRVGCGDLFGGSLVEVDLVR